jgi:hypothetical protein
MGCCIGTNPLGSEKIAANGDGGSEAIFAGCVHTQIWAPGIAGPKEDLTHPSVLK